MSRRILLAIVAMAMTVLAMNVSAVGAARMGNDTIAVVAPLHVERGRTTAVALRLPANVAAVEGRLFVDQRAVEVIGVAPRGGGTALRPVDAGEGASTFAAYGLHPVKGHTTLDLVVYPKEAGRLQVRVVIDAAADKNGHRLTLGRFNQVATLGVGRETGTIAAPQAGAASVPTSAAQATREFVIDGRFNSQDLDAVRGDWYARLPGHACGMGVGSDANSDGCVDVVDLQAQLAAQGQATAAASAPTAPTAVAALNVTFVVNSTADTPDAANGNGVCADSLGRCTLRAAMTEADWIPGDDRIEFALTGPAPVTIQLSSRLPNISATNGTLTIDGYSQPGSAVNTATVGSNAIMGVEIRGNGQAAREFLYITSANNTIRGLLFSNVWRGFFLDGAGAHDNHIIGNWIGFQKNGTSPGQGNVGVVLNYGANHNFVGQPDLADRNVIGNMTLGGRHLRHRYGVQCHPEQRHVHPARAASPARPARPGLTTTSGRRTTSSAALDRTRRTS